MKVDRIEWDTRNRKHPFNHGCTRPEIEDVISSRCQRTRAKAPYRREPDEERRALHGQACNRKYLFVVVEIRPAQVIRPITCYPLGGRDLDDYLDWRRMLARRHLK